MMLVGRGLGIAMGGALAVHAAALAVAWGAGGASVATVRAARVPAVLLSQHDAVPARPAPIQPIEPGVVAPTQTSAAGDLPDRQPDMAAQDASLSQLTPGATADPAASSPSGTDPQGFDYVPRQYLSLPPVPLAQIEVPFPESVGGTFAITTQLSLFIDETGVVRRVRVDGPELDPALEAAAVDAFRQGRFTPGQLDGRPVRSLVRIEVTFESRPADASSSAK
jgi:periplasmic protein TonB